MLHSDWGGWRQEFGWTLSLVYHHTRNIATSSEKVTQRDLDVTVIPVFVAVAHIFGFSVSWFLSRDDERRKVIHLSTITDTYPFTSVPLGQRLPNPCKILS